MRFLATTPIKSGLEALCRVVFPGGDRASILVMPVLLALAVTVSFVTAPPVKAQTPPEAHPPVVIESLEVQGNQRQSASIIIAESGLREGMQVTGRDVQRAIRRLFATGQYAWIDVKVREGEDPDGVRLTLEIVEQPYIAQIEFQGLQHARQGKIRDSVGLSSGAPLDPARVEEAKALTRSKLSQQGFQVKRLEHAVLPLEDRPGQYRLVIEVEEGYRVALASIHFQGNSNLSGSGLRGAMETHAEGFLWRRSGIFDPEILERDLRQQLPEYYAQHGFLDFTVLDHELEVDPNSGKGRLTIHVEEGPRYRLAGFQVQGNNRFSDEQLESYFQRELGGLLGGRLGLGATRVEDYEIFDAVAFRAATGRVHQLYRNHGYLYARVEPLVERIELEDGEPAVRVAWRIREGDPAYINRVSVEGNTFTHEQVIRDQITVLPGDVYNEDRLIESYRRIMALGFFESPLPEPQMEQTEEGDVNITFLVEEKQTGSINFGTSIGGGMGVGGFLGYDQPNLMGRAKAGHLHWEFGRWANNFEARFRDPTILDSRVSGSISLFNSRDQFFQFAEGERRRAGASARIGLPLPVDPLHSRFLVGYSISRTRYREFTEGSTVFGQEPGLQSTVTLGLARNTLDHPMFPMEGTRQEVEAGLSGGPLGGDAHFQKYMASGSWYVPLGVLGGTRPGSRPVRIAFGVSTEAGAVLGDRESLQRFPFERFWMGGVQFGRQLRGYGETTITPRGYFRSGAAGITLEERFGDAFLRLTAETAVRFTDNISVSLFYDAGNVWQEPAHINPTRLMRGAGIGVTMVTPFGPLGLDYAYGFDRDQPGWQLHFRLGQF